MVQVDESIKYLKSIKSFELTDINEEEFSLKSGVGIE